MLKDEPMIPLEILFEVIQELVGDMEVDLDEPIEGDTGLDEPWPYGMSEEEFLNCTFF